MYSIQTPSVDVHIMIISKTVFVIKYSQAAHEMTITSSVFF